MTGPEHYAKGEDLLAQADRRAAERVKEYGLAGPVDSVDEQLVARAHAHFAAAKVAAVAAAMLPDSESWRKALKQ